MVAVLSESQLKRLAKHKYNASVTTLFDPFMQVWWRWFVERLPLWIAPNTITILGLITNLVTTLILVYFSPQARSEVPSWSLHFNALGLFVYQTLDAVDGKQARRTGSSSPLGELFDHGCDAISMVVVITGASVAMKLGDLPDLMMFMCIAAGAMFYLTHWRAYVSGVVRFGKIDVTELQLLGVFIFFLTGFCGQDIFRVETPIFQLQVREVFLYGASIPALLSTILGIYEIFQGGVGKNGSSIADTSVLSPAVPLLITLYLIYYNYAYSNTNVFAKGPCLFVFAFGIVLAKVSILLLVACMSKSSIPMLDTVLLCPFVQAVNIHFSSQISEYRLVWFCLIFSTLNALQYCFTVITEICNYLNISCFRITSKPLNEESSTKEGKAS
ncbi:cholinephosphotransferase 1-like isoform X1 [Dendronephthya gigantea]|uniref:cholinephosphotransferase 1-like isoform X1 n=1 Tax=Dendronephthya gigantea TaxID=151771 RepID=UPI00106A4C7E|nr:cholinephosphotransferase 1-like isoform X1 [Dendronephthya gigantea]